MKSPSEIAKEIIKSATIHDSDEEKLHFVITEALITKALTAERQRQEMLEDEIKTLKRHWIEDDRDLNDLIAQNEKLVEALKNIANMCWPEDVFAAQCADDCIKIAQQVLKEVK